LTFIEYSIAHCCEIYLGSTPNQMVIRFDMICRGFDGIFPEADGRTLFACVGFVVTRVLNKFMRLFTTNKKVCVRSRR
jgi:hypothetical protein